MSVPEGWRVLRLGEMGRVFSGGTPSTSQPSYWGGTTPWCTPSEITRLGSRFVGSTDRCLSEEGVRNSSAVVLEPGSLIVCTRASIGDCAINTVPMATNQGFKSVTLSSEHDVEFVYYLLSHHKHVLVRYAAGSTFLELSKTDFERLTFTVPELAEQKRIAAVLTAWDEAIALAERRLEAARQRKRGLLQVLLTGRRRFPEFAGQPWREVRLGEIATIAYGKSPSCVRADDGPVPIFGTGGVIGQATDALCDGPAIILGRKGSIDRVQWSSGPFWATDTTYFVQARSSTALRWLYHYLGEAGLERLNEASGVPSLSRETLRSHRVSLPPLAEQRAIAETLGACDEEIDLLARKVAALREQKKGLMQRLLTGQVRVALPGPGSASSP